MPYEALILLFHETNWDLSLRAIFHELRLKLSGNTNNQVFTVRVLQRWAFNSNFKPTVLKPVWWFYGKNLFFPQKYGHPRDTQSLTAPKHFSRRNAWQRPIKSICDRAVFTRLSKGIGFGFGFTTPFGWLVYLLWFWFYDSQVKTALTGVYFHQKSVIYFCQGSMISKWCYAWKYCFKSRLDPVYLSKLIKLIHSIKAYNLP